MVGIDNVRREKHDAKGMGKECDDEDGEGVFQYPSMRICMQPIYEEQRKN